VILVKVGYYIGDYFAQKYGGHWFVNDIQESRFFARYVVGKFIAPVRENAMIDTFDAAQAYADTAPPRVLDDKRKEIESELERSIAR